MDPLAEQMPSCSSYNYAFSNPVIYTDPTGMAPEDIILTGTKKERQKILSSLQKLTDDKLIVVGDKVQIGKSNSSGTKKTGTDLIRNLINHDKDVTIDYDSNRISSGESPVNDINSMNGIGSDSKVSLSSNNGMILVEDSKSGKFKHEYQSDEMALGHELSHSLGTMDGTSASTSKEVLHYFQGRSGQEWERANPEELITTGFSGYQRNTSKRASYPTENKLRAENNLNRRAAYGKGWTDYQVKKRKAKK